MSLPLAGRVALVTGVSRRRGIGFAIASRLASMGASLAVHHHSPHDNVQYGAADDLDSLLAELTGWLAEGARLVDVPGDLGDAQLPQFVVNTASGSLGHLDVLVCNQAHGGDAVPLAELTSEALDRH